MVGGGCTAHPWRGIMRKAGNLKLAVSEIEQIKGAAGGKGTLSKLASDDWTALLELGSRQRYEHGTPIVNEASVFPVNPQSGVEVVLPAFHPVTFIDFSTGMTIILRSVREPTAPTRGRRARARWRG